jgi:ATP-binding cassette subfamily C protein LapB
VLELVQRVIVIDAGKVALDGPKNLVLAALAGTPPAGAAVGHLAPAQRPAAAAPVQPRTQSHAHIREAVA